VAVAGEVARSLRALYGREPAATIPNGIALEDSAPPGAGAEWRAANGFGADDLLVLSVARLEPQKNPLGLIEAFRRALGGVPHAHLLLAGDGSLRDEAQRDLPARVHLLGARTDVPALLAAADVFALASDWEGHPIAIMEAMAAGLPVAATAVGGVPELVEHNATGLLTPPRDMAALGAALAALAGDAELRRRMGKAARERSAGFGVAAMASAYARLFEQVAERTR
jgi:glycosyltransferase involved in cell wall biosynthesis